MGAAVVEWGIGDREEIGRELRIWSSIKKLLTLHINYSGTHTSHNTHIHGVYYERGRRPSEFIVN